MLTGLRFNSPISVIFLLLCDMWLYNFVIWIRFDLIFVSLTLYINIWCDEAFIGKFIWDLCVFFFFFFLILLLICESENSFFFYYYSCSTHNKQAQFSVITQIKCKYKGSEVREREGKRMKERGKEVKNKKATTVVDRKVFEIGWKINIIWKCAFVL